MRKSLVIFPLMLLTLLAACGNKTYTSYQCPMKCEGEKTYDKAGNCPVCNMELEGVESK